MESRPLPPDQNKNERRQVKLMLIVATIGLIACLILPFVL